MQQEQRILYEQKLKDQESSLMKKFLIEKFLLENQTQAQYNLMIEQLQRHYDSQTQ